MAKKKQSREAGRSSPAKKPAVARRARKPVKERASIEALERAVADARASLKAMKRREEKAAAAFELANSMVDAVCGPLLVLDAELRVRYANDAFYKTFDTTPLETAGRLFDSLAKEEWNLPRLQKLLNHVWSSGEPLHDFEIRHHFPAIGERILLLNARRMVHRLDDPGPMIIVTFEDVTDRRKLKSQLINIADEEQRRIGQELHDSVGQELTGVAMLVEALVNRLQANSSTEALLAAKIRDGVRRSHIQVRSLSRGLMPIEMDSHELPFALDELAQRAREQGQCACRIECDGVDGVGDSTRGMHLYRIAQEAVSNAMRHARPKEIVIRLHQNSDSIILTIQDDGNGISDPHSVRQGSGIRIMTYRANLLGGTIAFHPAAGGGTVVACTIPKDALS